MRPGRVPQFKQFLTDNNPNIALVQETQLDNTIKLIIPGYNVLCGDVRKGWSGTAILIDSNIPIRNL